MTEKTFWRKWIEADEMEKIDIIRLLPTFQRGGVTHHMTATLMNSYLRDLYQEMKNG